MENQNYYVRESLPSPGGTVEMPIGLPTYKLLFLASQTTHLQLSTAAYSWRMLQPRLTCYPHGSISGNFLKLIFSLCLLPQLSLPLKTIPSEMTSFQNTPDANQTWQPAQQFSDPKLIFHGDWVSSPRRNQPKITGKSVHCGGQLSHMNCGALQTWAQTLALSLSNYVTWGINTCSLSLTV